MTHHHRGHGYGRKPKGNLPIPHFGALMAAAGRTSAAPKPAIDYYQGMATNFGMLLNGDDPTDPTAPVLGCCTCSGAYHARQVWTFNATGKEVTEPNACVEQMYREFCGYDGTPDTDQGGSEQVVLRDWMQVGIPLHDGTRSKILAVVQVNPQNADHMKHVIEGCGGVYTGLDVLQCFEQGDPRDWSFKRNSPVVGGHCTFAAKYSALMLNPISWGMTVNYPWDSVAHTMEEAYGLVTEDWVRSTGLTPGGLSLDQLQAAMQPFAT